MKLLAKLAKKIEQRFLAVNVNVFFDTKNFFTNPLNPEIIFKNSGTVKIELIRHDKAGLDEIFNFSFRFDDKKKIKDDDFNKFKEFIKKQHKIKLIKKA